MPTDFDIESTISNVETTKRFATTHTPSTSDRCFSLHFNPLLPHAVSPEHRHLRESTLLRWISYQLNDEAPVATLDELRDGKVLSKLIAKVAHRYPPLAEENHMQSNIRHAYALLQSWLRLGELEIPISTDAIVRGDRDQLMSLLCFILTQYQADLIQSYDDSLSFIRSHVR